MKKEKLVRLYLSKFSLPHAIPRINEALMLSKIPLEGPVLDLGCGDGRFAKILFGRKGIEIGLDPDPGEIIKARRSQAYQKIITASGQKIPLVEGSIKTVLANSVLEHVDNLDEILKECYRVLRIGGKLVLTVPTPLVSSYQFWGFIPGYSATKMKLWRHKNFFGEKRWRRKLVKTGFSIEKIQKTNSRAAIAWADIFAPLFFLKPLPFLTNFLISQSLFCPDPKGATLVIWCRKQL